jgi:multidrug resistance efflux pump
MAQASTRLSLSQDGNGSREEAEHVRVNWEQMLHELKRVVEGAPSTK